MLPRTENLVSGRVKDAPAVIVSEDFLEEAALELKLKGHFQFLATRTMAALEG